MGYITKFHISVKGVELEHLQETLEEISGEGFYALSFNQIATESKWYEHEDHIKAASTIFPQAIITVKGYGEEDGDIWVLYALAGQIMKYDAEIVFPACPYALLTTEYRTVYVSVLGVDIPVEIECAINTPPEFAYRIAKSKLKDLL